MGCCISKCKYKTKRPDVNPHNIQDKLVISQSSPPPSPPPKRQNTHSPPSTTLSSFTSSNQSSTWGSSSLSSASTSSSVEFSKVERSFSNDFLQSCAKENPQIVELDPNTNIRQVKQLIPGSTQKRARASSPTLARQKSIRVEKERSPNTHLNGRSITGSRSPSRRFNGHTSNYQRPPVLYTTSAFRESKCLEKANSRPASPNRKTIGKERPMYPKNKEKYGYGIGLKVEGVEVDEVLTKVKYSGPVAMTDINNGHVALDCFIFL